MRFLRILVVKLKYIVWSFKRINRPHLGDIVIYNNKKCYLLQGVANPYWDLYDISSNVRILRVHKSYFKLFNPLIGRLNRLKKSYNFQMSSWYRIDTWNRNIFDHISYKSI